jgi:hypothetical protein
VIFYKKKQKKTIISPMYQWCHEGLICHDPLL